MARTRRPFADERRMRLRCLASAVLFAAWLVAVEAIPGREPGRGPATDTGPPPLQRAAQRPDSVADPPANPTAFTSPAAGSDPAELDLWHQNLIRERQVEMKLRTAQRDLEAGRLIAGLTTLQTIIERDEDLFVRLSSDPVPCGAQIAACRILGSLPDEALATYESLFGAQAREELAAAAGPDPDRLGRLVRKFYHTEAGFEAGIRLAAYWSDHGHDELAYGWWQRVSRDVSQARRLQAGHRLRAAECCRQLGRLDAARSLLSDLRGSETVSFRGRQTPVTAVRERPLATTIDHGTSAAAEENRNAVGRNPSAAGTPPALGHVLWRAGLAGEQSRHLESLARAWESHQLQNGLPIGTSQSALLVGQRLVYRDYEGIRAVDVHSGRTAWFAPCASSVGREISARQTIPADNNPDPNNVMRHIVGNAGVQALGTDGRRVFAIDRIETEESPPAGAAPEAASAPRQQCSVLAAFDLAGNRVPAEATWTVGGRSDGSPRALQGHFFLGAPLAVAERLLVVSECRQQMYLSCLASETGRLIWTQPICSVAQPISSDHQRTGLACAASYAGGTVVCATQSGVLVAVDILAGTLLWAVSHDEAESQLRQQMAAWQHYSRRTCAHPAYVNVPVIQGDRIFYLPAHSEFLHCIDLTTGRVQWRTRREDLETATAIEYVAAATESVVTIVGRRRLRGLDVATGAERWSVRLGNSPSGCGVRLGTHYHVPLDNGGIVDLDLDSGRTAFAPPGAAPRPLGNLIAGNDVIVSMGPAEISVFPQAQPELDRLRSRGRDRSGDPQAQLEVAELELALGRLREAELRLEALLKQRPGLLATDRAQCLLHEVLCRKLGSGVGCSAADLARFAGLSQKPAYFGKYLLARQRAGERDGEPAGALALVRESASWPSDDPLTVADDPSRAVSGQVLAAELVRRAVNGEPTNRAAVDEEIGKLVDRAVRNRETTTLRRLIGLIADRERLDDARMQLAQRLLDEQQHQQAETVLLECRESKRAATAARATRLLAELWTAQGLPHDAARLFVDLAGRFADIETADGQSGAAWIAARRRDDPAFEAYRRLSRPAWSGAGVRIVEGRVENESLKSAYNGAGVQILTTPRQSAFDLFDRGRGTNGVFSLINRHTGQEYPETIQVPGRFLYPASAQNPQSSFVGNFVPVGGVGAMHGISLLERRLLWTTVPPELAGLREVVRVGPAGPGFCMFQLRQHLFALDPLDGRLLWRRDDLEGTAGLMNEAQGIIGDDRVLVVFATNGANYTVYETATGAELRRGKIDAKKIPRRVLGRRLFHDSAAAEDRRARVWDPLTDRCTWEEAADAIAEASALEGMLPGTKVLGFVRDTEEAAYVTSSGTIRVVDVVTGRKALELALPAEHIENSCALRAFRDRDRYFFSLQRSVPPGKPIPAAGAHMAINDTVLPALQTEGDLLAVDAASGRLLWRRPMGKRTLLQVPDLSLPVLVSLSRTRRDDQSFLAVEVLDIQTGETLVMREDLLSDRLLQAAYDPAGASLELRGAKTVIRLEFPTSVAQTDPAVRR